MKIIEYQEIDKNLVGEGVFRELEEFAQNNPQILAYSKKGILKSQNYVGVLQTKSGFVLEILPKIAEKDNIELSKNILIKMLKTLKNTPFKKIDLINLKTEKFHLLDIFIEMFIDEVFGVVKKGIKSDYIVREENQPFLKGKLLINKQIQKNFIHKERFFVEFDEYLPNRIENRILKTAILKLFKLTRKQKLRELLFIFDEIKTTNSYNYHLSKDINYYKNALVWAVLFLNNKSFTPYKGDNLAFGLFFDMNYLFESYVGDYFKKKCQNVLLQDNRLYLFENPKKYNLKPDIVINNQIIIDTKWKIKVDNEKSIQSDIYQMLVYGIKYKNVKNIHLIYPYINQTKQEEYNIKIYDKSLKIAISYFDLKQNKLLHYPQTQSISK
jgi:5-methylcytosine-specific restriction enzyme subunit McrC